MFPTRPLPHYPQRPAMVDRAPNRAVQDRAGVPYKCRFFWLSQKRTSET